MVLSLSDRSKLKGMRLVWAFVLCIAFPFAILTPFFDALIIRQVSIYTVVPFELSNTLLFTSSILFGFTSLIVVTKEWIDKRVWALLVPLLMFIILSGVAIGNFAMGSTTSMWVFLYSSAASNANVVSTGFVVGYVTQQPSKRTKTQVGS